MNGLNSFEDIKLYKAALGYLSDIAHNLKRYTHKNFFTFMDLLIKGLNTEITREIKINILDTIGDCISTVGILAEKYLPILISTIRMCYSIASEPCQ